ncbi:MAG: hypothetical protein WBV45_06175 [Lutimonas sp.]
MKRIIASAAVVMLLFVSMSFSADEAAFGAKKFVGLWEYDAPNAPYGYQNGLISLTKEKKSLKGTISIGSYTSDLDEIVTKKNKLTGVVNVEGERVQLELDFDKNSFEGVAMSSQGNIPMTGKRKSE